MIHLHVPRQTAEGRCDRPARFYKHMGSVVIWKLVTSLTADVSFGHWNSIYFLNPLHQMDGWLWMPYGEKQWKEAVEVCKVLIPGNDGNQRNLSEDSQLDDWTVS
jgi:hypothetical protein